MLPLRTIVRRIGFMRTSLSSPRYEVVSIDWRIWRVGGHDGFVESKRLQGRLHDMSTSWYVDFMVRRLHGASTSWCVDFMVRRLHGGSTSWWVDFMRTSLRSSPV